MIKRKRIGCSCNMKEQNFSTRHIPVNVLDNLYHVNIIGFIVISRCILLTRFVVAIFYINLRYHSMFSTNMKCIVNSKIKMILRRDSQEMDATRKEMYLYFSNFMRKYQLVRFNAKIGTNHMMECSKPCFKSGSVT